MRSSLARRATTLLLAQSLLCSIVFSQQQSREESRPRRVQAEWPQPPAATSPIPATIITPIVGAEPNIRVALVTDARSATISTTSRLMNATGGSTTLLALDTSRVRVEPHLLSPQLPANKEDTYRVMVGGASSREEAEENAKEIKRASGEESQVAFDMETKTWGLMVGAKRPREEAEELRARLEVAGMDATVPDFRNESTVSQASSTAPKQVTASATPIPSTGNSGIRLASRSSLPSRELIAFSPTAGRLFNSSAPVAFASYDEKNAPVRFNDRPYRGRIEVFTNSRGTLTVVNELGLEDYVRGVVANELSPGGYPALEALKAQAVAARTYALRNRGQFMSQGFDVLPTTRSQVYRGLTSENALSTRAVDETRGLVATYNGEPINALYTSTCGGRTEDAENIFNQAVPYLRGRECAVEGKAAFTSFTIKTTREPADLREDRNVPIARDVGLLAVENFGSLHPKVSDSWLAGDSSVAEVRSWLANVARLAHQIAPAVTEEVNRPPGFATALTAAVFGESRATTLLNNADVDYLLAVRDAQEVPVQNRPDLALLIRDGYFSVYPDATLRPREPLSRARVLHTIAHILEARNLLQLQKANARPAADGTLILRSTRGKDQPIRVSPDAFLFRQIGESPYAVRSVVLVGGEPVTFHVGGTGQVDYLEVKPAPNGAAADRMSPFTNWTTGLSVRQVQARLARTARGMGSIVDLRVVSRGSSRRVTDLEVIGTNGTAHVRGGHIRSALGLREQLFVIDREYDENGRVSEFVFTGRGWGHGVGMCQVGAYGLAKQGFSYEQILKAYYTGIELTKMY
jgi:stage II sporulation protein D